MLYIIDSFLSFILNILLIFYYSYPTIIQDYINKIMSFHFYINCIIDNINNINNIF